MIRSLSILALALGSFAALGAQTISVDKNPVTLNAPFGGAKVSTTLNFTTSGSAVNFSVQGNASWLGLNPTTGTTPSAITVTADPTGLSPATYGASISVFVGATLVLTVPVNFTVGSIGTDKSSLSFTSVAGSTPPSQTLTLSGQNTSFSASASTTSGGAWLSVGPTTGNSPTTLIVTLNSAVVPSLGAGTYNGTITITPATGPALTVPVTLTVSPTPTITVAPTTVNLGFQIGGTNNSIASSQTMTVATVTGQALSFSVAAGPSGTCVNPSGVPWVTINPTTVSQTGNSAQVTLGYDSTKNLPASTTPYTCQVVVSAPGFSPVQTTVTASLLVSTSPQIVVPTAPLNFTYELNGAVPAAQSVTAVATSGTIPITINASSSTNNGTWIVVPNSGVTGTPFTIAINPTGLGIGTYTGTVTVTGTGAANGPQAIPVKLIVANDPLIVANGCSAASTACGFSFAYQIGQAAPSPQNITLTSSTGAPLNYTVTAATSSCSNWLGVSGSPGSTGATGGGVTVSVFNTASLAAGTCTGTLTIDATNPTTGAEAPNSPLVLPVTLVVSNSALLVPSPNVVTITTPINGSASQQLALNSTNPATAIGYSVTLTTTTGGPWLSVNQSGGSTPSILLITATPGGNLPAGTYNGSVTITATGSTVANSPLVIPVNLVVSAGSLTVSTNTLNFSFTLGGSAPANQTVTVGSSGQSLTYTATANSTGNWLSVTPTSGTTGSNPTLTVAVNPAGLTAGPYTGTVTVVAGGSSQIINVNFTVSPGTISAPTTTLTFSQVAGGTAPQSQTVNVTGTPGSLAFTVAATTQSGGTWLTATGSGNTPGTVTVSVNGSGLTAAVYNGTITITANATGSPIAIPVTFNVLAAQTLTASPTQLNFGYTVGLTVPAAQNLNISAPSAGTVINVSAQTTSGPAGWLVVSPATATTPGVISVSVNTSSLTAAGSFSGTITITSPTALNPLTVPVTLSVTLVPTPVINAVVNAASNATGAVSPGENIVIYGTGIGPAQLTGIVLSNGVVSTVSGNTRVLFDGVPAPMIYASANQTSVMVPYGVSGRTSTNVQVEYLGVQSPAINYQVTQTAPGIYSLNLSGTGPGATLNQNGSVNSPTAPAAKGAVVSVYMTGEGQTTPPGVNGAVTPPDGSLLKNPLLGVTATIGGVATQVAFAGSAPSIVSGVMQVNLVIPAGAPSGGAVPLVISVGGVPCQSGITISIQ